MIITKKEKNMKKLNTDVFWIRYYSDDILLVAFLLSLLLTVPISSYQDVGFYLFEITVIIAF